MFNKDENHSDDEDLRDSHSLENIEKRIKDRFKQDYLRDAMLGGVDGGVSTFAIVAGTIGGGFPAVVALALGLASLIADGLSMAISNFQATKSVSDRLKQVRKEEAYQIENLPEGERKEIRYIFSQKGFEGELLEKIVEVITKDKSRWIDTMIQEEFGLPLTSPNPFLAAIMTYLAFLTIGLIPLVPFFWILENVSLTFTLSCILTGISFAAVGVFKGIYLKTSIIKESIEVLVLGSLAALSSYYISHWVTQAFT